MVIFAIGGRLRDIEPNEDGVTPNAFASSQAIQMALAGAVMLPLTWLIAKSSMPGQAMGATFVGGLAAGLAGRLVAANVQPILLFVSPIFFGAIGHLVLALLDALAVRCVVRQWKSPEPCERDACAYVAGSLMGVSMGLGWARSFLHHHEETAGAVATASPGR